MSETFEILVERIASLFNKKATGIAEVLTLLNLHERTKLLSKLDASASDTILSYQGASIELKADILNSLILAMLSKPQLQSSDPKAARNLFKDLYKLSFEVYAAHLDCIKENDLKKIETLILLTLFGMSGDRTPEVAIFIDRHRNVFQNFKSNEPLETLKVQAYEFLVTLFGRINSSDRIEYLTTVESKVESTLNTVQKLELQKEKMDITQGLALGALANLIHITKIVKKFLYSGLTGTSENVYSMIATYVFNAVQLAENANDEQLRSIVKHAKSSFDQLCSNSIWNIADQSPLIKKFFQNGIESKENMILTLMPSQRESLLQVLSAKKSIVINMPTSSGKSLLAELYILYTIHNQSFDGFKPTVAYIVPTNALINQVKVKLKKIYEKFDYKIESLLPFYDQDSVEEEILRNYGHVDILITTPEKMDFMVRNENPAIKNLKLVILDEAHNISDETRGSKFELLLAVIKQKKKDVNFLLLSPFIKNSDTVAEWLGDTEQNSAPVTVTWTPTKQYVGCNILTNKKAGSSVVYFPTTRNNIVDSEMDIPLHVDLAQIKQTLKEKKISSIVKNVGLLSRYLKIGGTTLILSKGPRSAQKAAIMATVYFVALNKLEDVSDVAEIKRTLTMIKYESGENDPLLECLRYGVAYHHSQMNGIIKEQIEILASLGLIKVLFATTTLAQGLNFPITTVIFDTLILGGGKKSKEISPSTFWNVAGRAGRAYMDSEGHIIVGYKNSNKATKASLQHYIEWDTQMIISSLTEFFESIGDSITFDYQLVKRYPAISNFLQYLNHIVKVAYHYKLDQIDTNKIRSILNTSLFYKEGEFKQGFIETQKKISTFAMQYVQHLKGENQRQLTLADTFGVSDLSLKVVTASILDRERIIKETFPDEASRQNALLASKIILETKSVDSLASIVDIIAKFPEMKISLWDKTGKLDSESIAKVIIGWVNGQSVHAIAQTLDSPQQDPVGICNQYINSNLKNFIPWGINIYQAITKDNNENAKMLPSYIYYGVNDKESVILSKIGVPRFLVSNVKTILKNEYSNDPITIDNIDNLRTRIREINDFSIGKSLQEKSDIKDIVLNYV